MQTRTKVFVAGPTGLLGSQVVASLLDRGQPVAALVRPGTTREKKKALDALIVRGLTIIEGDITDPVEKLAGHLEGTQTVVSAVQGGPDVIVEGQLNLLQAAEKAGVRRFIPSDFAIDINKLDDEDNFMIGWRRQAARRFEGADMDVVSVLNGAFAEVMTGFMGLVDWEKGTLSHWGDPDQPMDVTTVKDTADYTAAAAVDPELPGGALRFAGDVLSMRGFHQALQRGTGRTFELRTLGTADELRTEIERRSKVTQNPFEYVGLQYQWCMVTGKSKFDSLDNERYPDVKPTSMEEFVRRTAPAA
ncbi:MAG TPA: NmrA family NAD(P)-binding protein [Micromonospora sp.]|nr:NmrA family NAD(P)-binding protein [Micromonospora sp.]